MNGSLAMMLPRGGRTDANDGVLKHMPFFFFADSKTNVDLSDYLRLLCFLKLFVSDCN